MADEIIEHYEDDWEKAVAWLTGLIPGDNTIYQKHMCHHVAKHQLDWLGRDKLFLIREPREMLTSLMKKLPNPTLTDIALPQQLRCLNTSVIVPRHLRSSIQPRCSVIHKAC